LLGLRAAAVSEALTILRAPRRLVGITLFGLLSAVPYWTYPGGRIFPAVFFVVLLGVFIGPVTPWRGSSTANALDRSRRELVVAKVAAAMVFAVGYAPLWVALHAAYAWLSGGNLPAEGATGLRIGAGALLVFPLCAAFGVGVGLLCHNRCAAVLGMLLYLTAVEKWLPRVGGPDVAAYRPGLSGSQALDGATAMDRLLGGPATTQPAWLPVVIFGGWAAVAVAVGITVALRREVRATP
jgi:hypothetical protein